MHGIFIYVPDFIYLPNCPSLALEHPVPLLFIRRLFIKSLLNVAGAILGVRDTAVDTGFLNLYSHSEKLYVNSRLCKCFSSNY